MPAVGLEPTRACAQQILSLHRLPFRHAGLITEQNVYYHKKDWNASLFLKKFKLFVLLFHGKVNVLGGRAE